MAKKKIAFAWTAVWCNSTGCGSRMEFRKRELRSITWIQEMVGTTIAGLKIQLMVLAILAAASPQEGARPIPDEAAVKAAEALVRDIFKSDYAKRAPADQAVLAKKLLNQAVDTKDDLPALYVLLREAHDRATQGGDARTSMEALDRLASAFKVNRLAMKQAAAATLGRLAKNPDEFKACAKLLLELADEAVDADAFDVADKALEAAIAHGKSAKDLPTVGRADAMRRELKEIRSAADRLKKARETLAGMPDDPAANEALGRHECLRKNNWAVGLPHLTKGADAGLKELAAKDLAAPQDSPSRITLGDGWWERGEKESGDSKASMRARAGYWYQQALPGLTGLTRARIEKRLAGLPAGTAPGLAAPVSGLAAWWKFDEGMGTAIADATGEGNGGILMGDPTWVAGKFGGALEFDGIDDWVNIVDTPRLKDIQKASYTLSAWFKPAEVPPGAGEANNANYAIILKPGFHNGLVFTSGATFSTQHWIEGEKRVMGFSSKALSPGVWYHVAGVIDIPRGLVKTFVDGRFEGSVSFPAGTPSRDYGNITWKIGVARPNSPVWGWKAKGVIDDVRMFSRALSDDEVQSLFTKP